MRVCVVGGGYVGLVTALGLADIGHHCVCVENNPERLGMLRAGRAHFYEPGIEELFGRVLSQQKFEAVDNIRSGMENADIAIIAVGTPSIATGIDVSQVRSVAEEIGRCLKTSDRFVVVAVKSTVVPGTTDTVVRQALESQSGKTVGEFGLAMNPEFLREGCAVQDFQQPDRIVIGASDARTATAMGGLYTSFSCPVMHTTLQNAEMIKYAANVLLACMISFSNEVTRICESVAGVDEETVMRGVHLDKRMWVAGPQGKPLMPGFLSYLRGGVGFGGSCFPKDVQAFERFAEGIGVSPHLVKAARHVNEGRAAQVVDLLEVHLGSGVKGRRVAVLGLAFKPDTDDTRESPGLRIVAELQSRGATVVVHDPMVKRTILKTLAAPAVYVDNVDGALSGADAAVIATSWGDYKKIDWPRVTKAMATPLVLDGRQVIPVEQRGVGFVYATVGRRDSIGPR